MYAAAPIIETTRLWLLRVLYKHEPSDKNWGVGLLGVADSLQTDYLFFFFSAVATFFIFGCSTLCMLQAGAGGGGGGGGEPMSLEFYYSRLILVIIIRVVKQLFLGLEHCC